MRRPRAILTDIEGTTTPIAFVKNVLFPYAQARLPALISEHAASAEIADALAEVRRLAPGREPIETLLDWMDADAKVAPLKLLQGIVWRHGYQNGDFTGALYPDVAPALLRWHGAGIRLAVYSSGSVAAQKLLFTHSSAGNLVGLFSDFHDTAIGPKRERQSYRTICGDDPAGWLFLSDMEPELAAAAAAGMAVMHLARPQDGTIPSRNVTVAADFAAVEAAWGGEPRFS